MPGMEQTVIYVFAAILILTGLKLFSIPVRRILRFVLNTALGFGVLLLLNRFPDILPVSLGCNFFNAAVIGLLGLPGVGLLILLPLTL